VLTINLAAAGIGRLLDAFCVGYVPVLRWLCAMDGVGEKVVVRSALRDPLD